jgi:Ca2+-binding EF-hand superfamily protein
MDFRLMFSKFDKDGNGTLDVDELKMLARKYLKIPPRDVSDTELEALFAFLDEDGGGSLDLEELVNFLENDGEEVSERNTASEPLGRREIYASHH